MKQEHLEKLIQQRFQIHKITTQLKEIKQKYDMYVLDRNDAHIVAGAHGAHTKYLISYNLKHFKKDKIKDKLDILIVSPALFLQYLRSQ